MNYGPNPLNPYAPSECEGIAKRYERAQLELAQCEDLLHHRKREAERAFRECLRALQSLHRNGGCTEEIHRARDAILNQLECYNPNYRR